MRLFELYNNQLITYYENSNLPMNILLELLNLKKAMIFTQQICQS